MKHSKRYNSVADKVDRTVLYSLDDAVDRLKEAATAKFDESVARAEEVFPSLVPDVDAALGHRLESVWSSKSNVPMDSLRALHTQPIEKLERLFSTGG